MSDLNFYCKEHQEFPEAFAKKLNANEAKIVIYKLARHYKLRNYWIKFTDRIGGGKCSVNGRIMLRWQTSIGIICHEVAHLYEFENFGKSKHRKQMYRIMARMINYAKKKNYWQTEIDRRLIIKPKPIPTKEELQEVKIVKAIERIELYENKLRYYNKFYSNKLKKARRSLAMLERNKMAVIAPLAINKKEHNGLPPTDESVGIRPTIL